MGVSAGDGREWIGLTFVIQEIGLVEVYACLD